MMYHDPDEDKPDHFTRDDDNTGASASRPSDNRATDANDPFAPAHQPASAPTRPRRRNRFRRFMAWSIALLVIVLGVCCYVRYFLPYAEDAQTMGYVSSVEKRGLIFKTYEGELLTHETLSDTTRVYQRDFSFSVPDDSLARLIQSYQGTGIPVRLTFKRYYAPVAWRGASTNVVTAVAPR